LSEEWTTIELDLGVADGNFDPVIALRSLGIYRRRQWRFRFPGEKGLFLVRASEEFQDLGS
jgi:hypothetical protein